MRKNLILQLLQPFDITRTNIVARLWSLGCLCSLLAAANTVCAQTTNYFYEGFETAQALDDWSASSGTWEIGVPTFGPATNAIGRRAFAGTNCAATVLGGNYTDNIISRLVGPNLIVPSKNQNPRLRFWHWFRFNVGDFGQVQIKTGTNDWQSISTSYSSTGGDVWSMVSIDLSPFAGRPVQLGFYFESHGVVFPAYNDVEAGWYIDEVTVITGAVQTLTANVTQHFEAGFADWSVESGTWQVGVPTSGPGRAHSGTNCAATVLNGDYLERASSANGVSSRFISPPFVATGQNPRLRFWHWFAFNSGDSGVVQVKAGTNDWATVSPAYSSSGGGVWSQSTIDLSAYTDQTVQVGFWFQASGVVFPAYNETAPGWYIDDVRLVNGPITFNDSESFESGWGDWSAGSGTWEVGVPTSGPGGAHSGTNCAATVLAGNYQERVGSANGASSRFISPSFVVPPAASNPRLRFWQWFSFNSGDSGQVQIKVGTNDWLTLSPVYAGSSGGVWTQPSFDLKGYAGQVIQVGFWFQASGAVFPAYNDTAPGWYIDEVRLVYDPALVFGSTIVRTQEVACLSLRTFSSAPAVSVSFSLLATSAQLQNVSLNIGNRFESTTITQTGSSEWSINLLTSPTNPLNGDETIGSICFTTPSTNSEFVLLTPTNLVITNLDTSLPRTVGFAGRAVIIGNEPLLDAWLLAGSQRMLRLYGKPNTTYEIQSAPSLAIPPAWSPAWTNIVPASMYYESALQGVSSNAPIIFFRATEQ